MTTSARLAVRSSSAALSAGQARRIALAAQGFADRRSAGVPDRRALRRVFGRIGLIQIDSVNVLVRSHYLPLFSRLGPYPTAMLDRSVHRSPRLLFEYWGHEASLLPVETHPLLRFRMQRAAEQAWGGVRRLARDRPDLVARVFDQVRERGPLTARAIELGAPRQRVGWGWNWSEVKTALEWLFWRGEVTAARRGDGFERVYDLPERVLPAHVLAAPTPSAAQAHRELLDIAGRALGVATEIDLRDYFRLRPEESRRALADLVEAGVLTPTTVEGWGSPAYLHRAARLPRRIAASALLSPFDSLVWDRRRTQRLFDMRLRLEIYTPAASRVHGYYVLPLLLGDRLAARVDLKADRLAGALRVRAAHLEDGEPPTEVARHLAAELATLAEWLGLGAVEAEGAGDLAGELRGALRRDLCRGPPG